MGHPEVRGIGAPSGSRSRWGPVLAFALVSASTQMLWLNFAPISTGVARNLGVSSSTVGILAEVFPLVYVLLTVPVGRALDRWFRPTLLVGAALTAGGAVLRLAGSGFAPVLAGQVVVAIGEPAVLNAVTVVASRSLTRADRVTGIAVGSAGTFVGFVLAFVAGLVLGAGRLRALLELSAAFAVISAALLAASSRWIGDAARDGEPRVGGDRREARRVWSDPVVRTVCGVVFVGFGVFVALTTWVQTLMEHHGVGARTADGLLLVMVGSGIVTAVLAPGPVARRQAQPLAIAVAAVGGGASCLVLAFMPGVATGYICLAVFGLVLLPALPVLLELLEARHPDAAGTATGLLWLAGNAGGVVVAVAVQSVIDHPTAAWIIMASGVVFVLPLSVRLGRRLQAGALG
jgi:predicted MFS family arabinose efflux permease